MSKLEVFAGARLSFLKCILPAGVDTVHAHERIELLYPLVWSVLL